MALAPVNPPFHLQNGEDEDDLLEDEEFEDEEDDEGKDEKDEEEDGDDGNGDGETWYVRCTGGSPRPFDNAQCRW